MAGEWVQRRLTAILSANFVNYSRLMRAEDAGRSAGHNRSTYEIRLGQI